MVVEIVSPGDESSEKLPYFAQREVDEVLIVDPSRRRVDWLVRRDVHYDAAQSSRLLDLGPAELEALIEWP